MPPPTSFRANPLTVRKSTFRLAPAWFSRCRAKRHSHSGGSAERARRISSFQLSFQWNAGTALRILLYKFEIVLASEFPPLCAAGLILESFRWVLRHLKDNVLWNRNTPIRLLMPQ